MTWKYLESECFQILPSHSKWLPNENQQGLGSSTHGNTDIRYGVKNWGQHLEDASDMPQVIDESESDTDGSVVEEWLYWLVKHT